MINREAWDASVVRGIASHMARTLGIDSGIARVSQVVYSGGGQGGGVYLFSSKDNRRSILVQSILKQEDPENNSWVSLGLG